MFTHVTNDLNFISISGNQEITKKHECYEILYFLAAVDIA